MVLDLYTLLYLQRSVLYWYNFSGIIVAVIIIFEVLGNTQHLPGFTTATLVTLTQHANTGEYIYTQILGVTKTYIHS